MDAARQPLVSVIVPAYNAARFIARTLDNVLQQTHEAMEIIVVDDGSVDETTEIVERFVRQDRRIRLVRQPNGGVSAARNTALAEAGGAFIAPLDADDLWHPTKLEKQLACFAAGELSVGVVYSYFAVIDEYDRVTMPRVIYHTPTGRVYPHLVVGNIVGNASAPLIRREALAACEGYDETFREGCEDLDLYLRLAERSDYALVPEFLVGYRRSRESMSMNIPKMERAIDQMTRKMLGRHPAAPRRLIRWRNGNMYRYLALHALMMSDYRRALGMAVKSVASDPLLLAGWMLRRLSDRLSVRPAPAVGPGPFFLASDPVPAPGETFRPTALEAWRQRVAGRVRGSFGGDPVAESGKAPTR